MKDGAETKRSAVTIVFAGGGTGGHLFPALAIADEIRKRKPDAQIAFVGTRDKLEARVVPQRGYAFHAIWISGLRRTWTFGNLLFPLKVLVACVQSFFLLRKLKPDVVVGTGGYVCGPPLVMASLLGIPTVIQEQNTLPGITTRLLAARATQVHLSFEATKEFLKRTDNIVVSGNPTRMTEPIDREEGLRLFHLNPEKKTLLVFGGSLGASSINRAVAAILSDLRAMDVQTIWQTGELDYESMHRTVQQMGADREEPVVRVYKFIDRMQYAYAACDLVVCRAGATTLAELTSYGVPAILVPYPFAAADHQRRNAEMMVRAKAAEMVHDADLGVQLLGKLQELLTDDHRRTMMAERARALGKPDAAATVATAVLALAER